MPTGYDMLRGAYGPFRANNDLLYYHLNIRVDPEKQWISGKNTIRFRMLKDGKRIQIDLRDTLTIAKSSGMLVNDSTGNPVVPAPTASFEDSPNQIPPAAADYGGVAGMPAGSQYVCAWGPNDPKPKMIRITMTVDDPGGRLADGQTYEYIYTLP